MQLPSLWLTGPLLINLQLLNSSMVTLKPDVYPKLAIAITRPVLAAIKLLSVLVIFKILHRLSAQKDALRTLLEHFNQRVLTQRTQRNPPCLDACY